MHGAKPTINEILPIHGKDDVDITFQLEILFFSDRVNFQVIDWLPSCLFEEVGHIFPPPHMPRVISENKTNSPRVKGVTIVEFSRAVHAVGL